MIDPALRRAQDEKMYQKKKKNPNKTKDKIKGKKAPEQQRAPFKEKGQRDIS